MSSSATTSTASTTTTTSARPLAIKGVRLPRDAALKEEQADEYAPGGYRQIHVGDTVNNGRYHVVRKLGFGHFSTVWLVKDERSVRSFRFALSLSFLNLYFWDRVICLSISFFLSSLPFISLFLCHSHSYHIASHRVAPQRAVLNAARVRRSMRIC